MSLRRNWWIGGLVAVSTLLAVAQLNVPGVGVGAAQTVIAPAKVDGALPVADPESSSWSASVPVDVPLSAQMVVKPSRSAPFVPFVKVQALYNSSWIAFLLTWEDEFKDNRTTANYEFRDAAAVQIAPSGTLPNICMGAKGQRLEIMQWKADWQADIEEGFRDLQDTFPNFWVDVYPYAIGSPPYKVPDAFNGTARDYLIGWKVGNPFSQPLKVTAVEDAYAEGFGTIESQPHQDALGRGVWKDSTWRAVISRPLVTGDPQDPVVERGISAAFALWDGHSRDVGSRKSVSSWVSVEMPLASGEAVPFATRTVWGLLGVMAGLAVALAIIVIARKAENRWERKRKEWTENRKADADEKVGSKGGTKKD